MLLERIELSLPPYQRGGLPLTYKSKLVPQEGFEPPSDTLEECCLVQLDHCGINNYVKTYNSLTPSGLYFHLCLHEGVCCVMVQDIYDLEFTIRYFTNVNKALRFINNL